jgi:Ca-activated chloride channel family protein
VSFEWPLALVALVAAPIAVAAYVVVERRRAERTSLFATPALLPSVVSTSPGRRRYVPAALLLAALALVLLGLARPHAVFSQPREEATVVLALDISYSMTATDVHPTRLGAARGAAERFLDQVPKSFRVGMVAFATRANAASPATDDRDVTRSALASLKPGEGTALGEAIALSVRMARSVPREEEDDAGPPPAAILLLSDGAQTQGQLTPPQAAQQARRAGIPIFTVALGTDEGIVERPVGNGLTERIRVPPEPRMLRRVASLTGGEFFEAADAEELARVYEDLGSRLGSRRERHEVTAAFAGAGALLVLVAGAISAAWFRRVP